MMHFSKKTIPSILFAALISACGGQSTTDTFSDSTVHKTTQAVQTTKFLQQAQSGLMDSLAVAYPNGQIPAANAIKAAQELAENPAVLQLTTQSTAQIIENTSAPIQSQALAPDYKPVTRIQNTSLTGAYFFTIYDAECKTALANNYNLNLEGAAFWASLTPDAALSPVHRFRNVLNGSYIYTIYDSEKLDIINNYRSTFLYEGVAWYAKQTAGTGWSPLYRFRNLLNGTYLFSAYETEKNAILRDYSAVFKLEGVAYYVRQDGAGAVTNSVPAVNGTSLVTACGNVYFDPIIAKTQYPVIMNAIISATQSVKSAYGTLLSTQPDIIVCSSTACGTYFAGPTLRNLALPPGSRVGQYTAPRMTVVLISATWNHNPYVLAHEFSHVEVNIRLNGSRVPAWFDEGLATYVGGEPICTNVTNKGIASLLSLDSQAAWVTYTNNPAVIVETYCQARAEVAAWVARRGTAAINQLLQAVSQGQSFTSQYGAMQTQ
jgi:hypothetical protein